MGRPLIVGSNLRIDAEEALRGLDWREVFGTAGPVEIELGIGKGRFLLAAAERRPDVFHLGVEWANKYLRIAEARAVKRALENVRFVRADGRDLVQQAIPDASVRAYYIFYPDPWPKKRHHKRRFFRPETVEHLGRTLEPGGWLHVATDHREYWEIIEGLLGRHPAFERWPEFGGSDFPLPPHEPLTNYELKYLAQGRPCARATWRRRPS